ncbi:hypothetical protein EON63_10250 [archaeon]|nr:MAG: hypothetical protein EON63_10250 [archaeon]
MTKRPAAPYSPAQYAALCEQVTRSLIPSSSTKEAGGGASWILDSDAPQCMRCSRRFSFLLRRHHCRRCGQVVCEACAPSNNSRPILEWGLREAVRHCRGCFKSPLIDWND